MTEDRTAELAEARAQVSALLAGRAVDAAIIAEQARTIADQARTIVALSMPAGGSSLKVRAIYDRFEAAMKTSKSWRAIRNRLRPFLVVFGDSLAMTVTPPKWAEYRERRKVDDVICGKAVAPLTINFELDWAKRMFSWATEPEQNLLPANPLEKAKREKTDSARETWLTEEQLEHLLAKCGPVIAAFVLVAVDTGLRISEVLTLRRDRLRYVEVADGRTFAVGEISKRRTKGKRSHTAALTPRCLAALDVLPETTNPYLLPSPKKIGASYSVRQIARLFRAACVASGVDVFVADGDGHIRVHDLRHTAATAAARRGGSLPQVQQMLNHSSPSITARYIHLGEDDVIAIAQIMDTGAIKEKARRPPRRAAAASATVDQKNISFA